MSDVPFLPVSIIFRFGAEMDGDAVAVEPAFHGRDEFGVVERQDLFLGFDDRDLAAEFGEGDAEFEADVTGADDDEFFGQRVERERFGRGDHRAAERDRRDLHGERAVGEDHVFGGDRDGPVADGAGFGVGEFRPAVDDFAPSRV